MKWFRDVLEGLRSAAALGRQTPEQFELQLAPMRTWLPTPRKPTIEAILIGGRHDHVRVMMSAAPPRIQIGIVTYRRIDDPDTGEFLGGYAYEGPVPA